MREDKMQSLHSILESYRPINAGKEDIARIRRLYSGLSPRIFGLYHKIWECLMVYVSSGDDGKAAIVSNLGFLCLLDLERTLFLQQIIERTLSRATDPSGLKVIDLGAGTGILGLTAVELGARDATLVENDRECLEFLEEFLPEIGFVRRSNSKTRKVFFRGRQRVEVCSCDAKSFKPGNGRANKYDLVVCEMHETHLVSEDEVAALRNIRRYAKKDALFIPSADELMVSVCDSNGRDLSRAAKIGSVDFGDISGEGISFEGKLEIMRAGKPRYLKLWDRLYYPDNTVCEQEFTMFAQTKYMVLRGFEPVLKRGQQLFLRAGFRFGDRNYNGYCLELARGKAASQKKDLKKKG